MNWKDRCTEMYTGRTVYCMDTPYTVLDRTSDKIRVQDEQGEDVGWYPKHIFSLEPKR